MLNALIFDPEKCCSSIVRCILRGRGMRASVSYDLEEAGRKFETGLFDIVFVDASADADACALFIESIHELTPGLPVILLHRGPVPEALAGAQVFRQVAKPLRVGAVSRAAEQAAASLATGEHRRWPRRPVDLAVELSEGGDRVAGHATNISLGGLLVECPARDEAAVLRFQEFFTHEHANTVLASLPGPAGRILKLSGTVAFTERSHDNRVLHAGISFVGLPREERESLEQLLQGAA
jgi:hypothetical protein